MKTLANTAVILTFSFQDVGSWFRVLGFSVLGF
jgi:hypothetical protein